MQTAGLSGSGSQVSSPSALPSPHTFVQSAGQVGSAALTGRTPGGLAAKSQVSPRAVSTTPLPQVRLLHETTVCRLLLHWLFVAVTLIRTASPGPVHFKLEALPFAGVNERPP